MRRTRYYAAYSRIPREFAQRSNTFFKIDATLSSGLALSWLCFGNTVNFDDSSLIDSSFQRYKFLLGLSTIWLVIASCCATRGVAGFSGFFLRGTANCGAFVLGNSLPAASCSIQSNTHPTLN